MVCGQYRWCMMFPQAYAENGEMRRVRREAPDQMYCSYAEGRLVVY